MHGVFGYLFVVSSQFSLKMTISLCVCCCCCWLINSLMLGRVVIGNSSFS